VKAVWLRQGEAGPGGPGRKGKDADHHPARWWSPAMVQGPGARGSRR